MFSDPSMALETESSLLVLEIQLASRIEETGYSTFAVDCRSHRTKI